MSLLLIGFWFIRRKNSKKQTNPMFRPFRRVCEAISGSTPANISSNLLPVYYFSYVCTTLSPRSRVKRIKSGHTVIRSFIWTDFSINDLDPSLRMNLAEKKEWRKSIQKWYFSSYFMLENFITNFKRSFGSIQSFNKIIKILKMLFSI